MDKLSWGSFLDPGNILFWVFFWITIPVKVVSWILHL